MKQTGSQSISLIRDRALRIAFNPGIVGLVLSQEEQSSCCISDPGSSLQGKFCQQSFMPECLSNVRHIALGHIVASHTRRTAVRAQPSLLQRQFESTLVDGVLGELTHINRTELVDLGSHRVFFNQRFFRESKLQRIIGGQGHVEPTLEEAGARVLVVRQEQRVVTEGRHGDADLVQVVEILQQRHLAQQDTVADAMAAQEADSQMIGVTSLTAVRPKDESVEPPTLPPVVERGNIGKHEVDPIAVRWILLGVPFAGNGVLAVEPTLRLALVIDTVESDHSLEEDMKLGVTGGILGHFEQWLEHVRDDLFEILHHPARLVHVVQTRNLDEPSNVGGK